MESTEIMTSRISELLHESNQLRYSDTRRSLLLAEEAYRLADPAIDARLAARSLMMMMICHNRLGNNETTIELGHKALKLLTLPADRSEEVKIMSLMGNAFFARSDFSKAMDAFSAGLDYYRQSGNRANEAISLTQLGGIHYRLGDYEKALEAHCHSLNIAQEIQNRHTEASSSNNIAMVYLQLKDYPNSLKYFTASHHLFQELGDKAYQANTLDNISVIYDRLGEPQKALDTALASLALHESAGDKPGCLILGNLIGGYCMKLGDSRRARRFQIGSIRAAHRTGDRFQQAVGLKNLGDIWMELEDRRKAEFYFRKALAISSFLGTQRLCFELNERLAAIREASGDFEDALRFYRKFHAEKEAIFNQDSDQRIRSLQIRFDSEQKQRENEIFRLKIEQQRQELQALAATIAEQNIIIQSFEKNVLRSSPDTGTTSEDTVRETIRQLKHNQISAKTWDEFQKRFAAMYPDFAQSLLKKNPAMTRQELRICSLIKTRQSSSRIAGILFISRRSVDWHRYQIRKKLGLAQEQELSRYLESL